MAILGSDIHIFIFIYNNIICFSFHDSDVDSPRGSSGQRWKEFLSTVLLAAPDNANLVAVTDNPDGNLAAEIRNTKLQAWACL